MSLGQHETWDDDVDFESPQVVPSREIGRPFPQGVGGERTDAYIARRIAGMTRPIAPKCWCGMPKYGWSACGSRRAE